jgi:hypothetical protein
MVKTALKSLMKPANKKCKIGTVAAQVRVKLMDLKSSLETTSGESNKESDY